MKEIWKAIEGYEGLYQVSNLGRVKSKARDVVEHRSWGNRITSLPERIMKQSYLPEGYKIITLSKNSKQKTYRVHRLVAQQFLPNPENKPDINHKNGIREDNRVENLEWVTNLENQRHSWSQLGRKQNRTVKVLCVEINKEFDSIKDAAEYLGLSSAQQAHITDCLRGRRRMCGGFHWKYADEK